METKANLTSEDVEEIAICAVRKMQSSGHNVSMGVKEDVWIRVDYNRCVPEVVLGNLVFEKIWKLYSSVRFEVKHTIEWLLLHELQHLELGHFELLRGVPTLHLISRSKRSSNPINGLLKELWHKVEPCLELQADHDAIDLMLDRYSNDGWQEIRTKAASIAAAMVLIEKIDRENGIKHSTHPKAATRIFQLLGHITEMWSIPAFIDAQNRREKVVRSEALPSEEEQLAFSEQVILPVFWDTGALAEAASAQAIIEDLGSPEDFFADVTRAKFGQWNDLKTVGSTEWAKLKNINEMILPSLKKIATYTQVFQCVSLDLRSQMCNNLSKFEFDI